MVRTNRVEEDMSSHRLVRTLAKRGPVKNVGLTTGYADHIVVSLFSVDVSGPLEVREEPRPR